MKDELGTRLRGARSIRGMTQEELGASVDMSGVAIRLYELGKRKPSSERLDAIANILEVASESLKNLTPSSNREILEILFRLEDEHICDIDERPGGQTILSFSNANKELMKMLNDWKVEKGKLEAAEITSDEYKKWKMRYR